MIRRYKRPNPVSPKRKSRVGKLGIERLAGPDVDVRRREIGERDGWVCEKCGIQCNSDGQDSRPKGEWAHRGNKRMYGDGIGNGRILCGPVFGRVGCHQKEHNAGGKPCPPKPTH